jgi:hypothetical protein
MNDAGYADLTAPFYPVLPDLQKNTVFGGFPGFTHVSFWKEQHVDNGECVTLLG